MLRSRLAIRLVCALSLAVAVSSCSAESEDLGADDAEVMGGTSAYGPEYAAVGRIVIGGIGGCVGTLVSPQIVISARHCRVLARRQGGLNAYDVSFDVHGNDGQNKRFDVVAELTTGRPGIGALGFGRDVAVMMLAEPVPAAMATPIPVRARPLDASDVGRRFTGVAFDSTQTWLRVKGRSTVDAVEGKPYQRAFSSFEKMEAAAQRELEEQVRNRSRASGTVLALTPDDYDLELSAEAYEAHVGLSPRGRARGDVQYCHGDSGGPLLDRIDGHYELVAVITGGEDECVLGEIVTWVGPDYIDALSKCDGSTPWAWACDPTKSRSEPKVSRCRADTKISCAGSYESERHWFTDINVQACGSP